jgi:uncharacterized protein YdaU (DUF1376 family)
MHSRDRRFQSRWAILSAILQQLFHDEDELWFEEQRLKDQKKVNKEGLKQLLKAMNKELDQSVRSQTVTRGKDET